MIALGDQLGADDDVDRAIASTEATNSATFSGDHSVSEVTMARAPAAAARTSSAIRSTPGPQATSESGSLHSGQARARRHDMAAMVAGEAMRQPVLDHPGSCNWGTGSGSRSGGTG
jgi:hypothetical protein